MSARSPSLAGSPNVDDWLRIDPGGAVTVYTGKVELGQGILRALARIAAEELCVALERVCVVPADTAHSPEEAPTVSSLSLEHSGRAIRQAAATARERLVELAAARLDVPPGALRVTDGTVHDVGRERELTYWELVAAGVNLGPVRDDAAPVDPGAHRIVGRRGPPDGLVDIVTGAARFVSDLEEPGTLHGRVVRPPTPAATLRMLDADPVRELEGVVAVVRRESFVGVIAEAPLQATRAAEVLAARCRWTEPPSLVPSHRVPDWMRTQPAIRYAVVEGSGVLEPPGVPALPSEATHTLAARYTRPFHMHGSIGPSAALACWTADELTVTSHSQAVHVLRDVLAGCFGLAPDAVRVRHVPGAGCYGHNGADDAAYDAALLAQVVPGRPVLVTWTRTDEHTWEPYGPAAVVEVRAGLDADGAIVDWGFNTWSSTHFSRPSREPGGERFLARWHTHPQAPPATAEPLLEHESGVHRNAEPIYALPRRRIMAHLVDVPLRTSSLRSLGSYPNIFAIESFMDELAHAAGLDPLEFRLRHLEDPRAREVVTTAAERAGWSDGEPDFGHGRGIALSRYKNSACFAAVVVEVSVDDESAEIRLERATIAADAGEIVDPDGLVSQLEGGFVQSASWTLFEQVTCDDTRITSVDWDTYPIIRFPQVPEVDVVLIDRPGSPYLGAGEATQPPTPAAIANAVYAAVGVRIRDIPFTPERLRRAAAEA